MEQCIETVRKLAGIRSRNEKIALLKEELKDETFRKFVKYAVDPFITYGISSYDILPNPAYGTALPFFDVLDKINKRELTGSAARETLGVYALLHDSVETAIRIILNKDLGCNVGAKTINAAWPGLIREFPIAKAKSYSNELLNLPYLGSPKYDGFRCLAVCMGPDNVSMLSSNGKEFPGAEYLKPCVASYYEHIRQPFVFDGELLATGGLYKTGSYARRKKAEKKMLHYKVFDYIPYELFVAQMTTMPLFERLAFLESLLPTEGADTSVSLTEHVPIRSVHEVQIKYREYLESNFEGLMLKEANASYHYGRGSQWLKLKPTDTLDLVVLRALEGTGKFVGMLGALVVDYRGKEVHIGYGYSDQQRKDFWSNMPEVIEVEFQEITPDKSLRDPRFVRVRNDKT